MDYTYFELKSKKKATVTRKYAITILNSKGDKHAQFREGYNDFRKIKSIKGFIYDKDGKQIKKIKKKEINDVSAVSGGTLISDSRIKYIEVAQNNYPLTVEFEFEISFSGLLSYPTWYSILGYKISVEQSMYIAKIPTKLGMRYNVKNYSSKPEIISEDNMKTYTWKMENFQAIDSEPLSPEPRYFFPIIFLHQLNLNMMDMQEICPLGKIMENGFTLSKKEEMNYPQKLLKSALNLLMELRTTKKK